MFIKRSLTHESGQALIQTALAMVVIMVIMALAIDVGSLYAERRKMQNAADAGALAGAMVLCRGGDAGADALKLAKANGVQPQDVVITFPDSNIISVVVSTTAHSIFARILSPSFATTPVRARATAKCGPISTARVFPITTKYENYQSGQVVELTNRSAPGNLGWLNWEVGDTGGIGTPYLIEELLGNIPSPVISVGKDVYGEAGAKQGIQNTMDYLCMMGTIVIIPLYDPDVAVSGQGINSGYRVRGFAAFKLLSYDNSMGGSLRGQFVNMTSASTSTEGGTDFGVYGSRFTQ